MLVVGSRHPGERAGGVLMPGGVVVAPGGAPVLGCNACWWPGLWPLPSPRRAGRATADRGQRRVPRAAGPRPMSSRVAARWAQLAAWASHFPGHRTHDDVPHVTASVCGQPRLPTAALQALDATHANSFHVAGPSLMAAAGAVPAFRHPATHPSMRCRGRVGGLLTHSSSQKMQGGTSAAALSHRVVVQPEASVHGCPVRCCGDVGLELRA